MAGEDDLDSEKDFEKSPINFKRYLLTRALARSNAPRWAVKAVEDSIYQAEHGILPAIFTPEPVTPPKIKAATALILLKYFWIGKGLTSSQATKRLAEACSYTPENIERLEYVVLKSAYGMNGVKALAREGRYFGRIVAAGSHLSPEEAANVARWESPEYLAEIAQMIRVRGTYKKRPNK